MFEWFTEDATYPMIMGILLFIVFAIFAYVSRERVVVYGAGLIAILTLSMVICEAMIVTEKEQITEDVYQLAFAIEKNDIQRVLESVDSRDASMVARINSEMPRYRFDMCRLMGITEFLSTGDNPDTAEIEFTVTVRVGDKDMPEKMMGQRRVRLQYQRDPNGKWKIIDYYHTDPRQELSL